MIKHAQTATKDSIKRYQVTVSLGISGKSKEEAIDKLVKVIESVTAVVDGRFYGITITSKEGIKVNELPF